MVKSTVVPRLFRGLRDLLPTEMAARQWIIDTIRNVYARYGFVPLSTPAVEHLDVLTGTVGQETQQSIFQVQNPDGTEEPLGLRFDLTVPLARVVAQYRDIPRPFRRYQVAPVWRADKPDRGRYREFVQFDIDSVGVSSEVADLEIISAMCDAFDDLKVGRYLVRFSSRRILDLLLKYAAVPDPLTVISKKRRSGGGFLEETAQRPATDVFRVLDKLDKMGIEKIRLELTSGYVDESGDWIPGLGLSKSQVERIEEFLRIRGDRRSDVLQQVRRLFGSVSGADSEIDVLDRMSRRLTSLGYEDDRVAIDLSVARGLAYYTGPVFEAVLADGPQFGSVFGGGRYDDLVTRFLGERVPATGASIGVDRLLAALTELGRVPRLRAGADVLVTVLDPALMDDYLAMTYGLRREGVRTELFLGSGGVGKQLKYADKQQIPLAVMFGEDEARQNRVTIKDLEQGKKRSEQVGQDRGAWLDAGTAQTQVPRNQLIQEVKRLLAAR